LPVRRFVTLVLPGAARRSEPQHLGDDHRYWGRPVTGTP
jgi:hypothetical protein